MKQQLNTLKMIQKAFGKDFNFMKISEIIPYVLNEDLEKEFFFSQWEYSNVIMD